MAEMNVRYMGLNLPSPLIIGSSGLAKSVQAIKEFESNGAGAVVLKSLFEEQIAMDTDQNIKTALEDIFIYSEASENLDYIDYYTKNNLLSDYLKLIRDAKREVNIPIIASINCLTNGQWMYFAKKIEEAGADAIELNMASLPIDLRVESIEIEKLHLDILKKVKESVRIPVAVKIGPGYSNLALFIKRLSDSGADAVVLFNRFYSPDINIDTFAVASANAFSSPSEYYNSLRWIAIMHGKTESDLAASTGVHDSSAMIKQILAGAKVVEITSAVYKRGAEVISEILAQTQSWMQAKGFSSVDQFRGKISVYSNNVASFERIQFMKYFASVE